MMARTRTQSQWDSLVSLGIERSKLEIEQDIIIGRVPPDVATFGELHDHVDANEYGGLCDPGFILSDDAGNMSEETQVAANRIQDAVHEWILAGRPKGSK